MELRDDCDRYTILLLALVDLGTDRKFRIVPSK